LQGVFRIRGKEICVLAKGFKLCYIESVKLKRIEIRGFKSIAKKVDLPISEGITCIAGPNGCGKSNIVDAVRWAMGEQSTRSLRAGAMSDMIFSGTQEIGPGSSAQVLIEFIRDGGVFPQALEGFDQIAVSRKLFRSGESEYAINGVKCRLKDITDLFLDTGLDRQGYAIVEQGKVKEIIQSRPEDIRHLIEEAAAVGKFRVKRIEAHRRLEATSKNLERVSDLLSEVSRQRSELKAQANRARRYQIVRDQINELTRQLWGSKLDELAGKLKVCSQQEKELGEFLEKKKEELDALHASREELESRQKEQKKGMELISSALLENQAAVGIARADSENAKQRKSDIRSTLEIITTRTAQIKKSLKAELDQIGTETEASALVEEQLEVFQKEAEQSRGMADEFLQQYRSLDKKFDEKRAELFDTIGHVRAQEQHISGLEIRYQEVCPAIRKREDDIADLKTRAAVVKETLDSLNQEAGQLEGKLVLQSRQCQVLETQRDELRTCMQRVRETLRDREQELSEIHAKVSILDQVIQETIQAQDLSPESLNGNMRVSDAITARKGFEETVGRSVGEALEFLIIPDHEELFAEQSIEHSFPGFVPQRPYIEPYRSTQPLEGEGILGPLSSFIDSEKQYEDVIHALSRDMWVVDDIHRALSLWRGGQRAHPLVTRDGMILETTGVVRTTRTLAKYGQGLKAKADKDQLEIRKNEIEGERDTWAAQLKAHEQKLEQAEERISITRTLCVEIQRSIQEVHYRKQDLEKEHERISEQMRTGQQDLDALETLKDRLSNELALQRSEKAVVDDAILSLQDVVKELDARRNAARKRYEEVQASVQQQILKAHELKVGWASKKERIRNLQENITRKQAEIEKDGERISELNRTLEHIEADLRSAQQACEKAQEEVLRLESAYSDMVPEYEKISRLLNQLSDDLCRAEESVENLERDRTEALLMLREQEIAYSMGKERLEARFGRETPQIPDTFDPEKTRSRLDLMEKKLERMGQINFTSITAYEQAQARWDDLHRQYEDIVQASTRLKEVIANIERQSKKAFMETFALVRHHFQDLFTTMFGGGKADIVLEDGDSLESGVEIYASPPFKRLKAMSLLSEGEKTLCALSFIFALIRVRPAPFCVLDEVDASLDDANVIRFNRLIRSFSEESQFLVVTHNRYTMEMADILYGVTFDVPGISKVVSMALKNSEG